MTDLTIRDPIEKQYIKKYINIIYNVYKLFSFTITSQWKTNVLF